MYLLDICCCRYRVCNGNTLTRLNLQLPHPLRDLVCVFLLRVSVPLVGKGSDISTSYILQLVFCKTIHSIVQTMIMWRLKELRWI